MIRRAQLFFLSTLLAGGCAFSGQDSAASDSLQDDDLPMGGCDPTDPDCTGTGPGPGAPPGSPCDGTSQCADGGVCAAPFDDGDVGDLVCQLGCVQTGDPTAWCSDDATCCSGVCGLHGECQPGDAGDSTATSGVDTGSPGSGSTDSGGTDSGGTDSRGTDSGGTDSGGTDSGGSTTAGDASGSGSGSGSSTG